MKAGSQAQENHLHHIGGTIDANATIGYRIHRSLQTFLLLVDFLLSHPYD